MCINAIALQSAASLTRVDDNVIGRCSFDSYRLHHPAAWSRTIARIHIDMLAPKTLWTVIGISVARNACTTMLTDEVLYRPLEHAINSP